MDRVPQLEEMVAHVFPSPPHFFQIRVASTHVNLHIEVVWVLEEGRDSFRVEERIPVRELTREASFAYGREEFAHVVERLIVERVSDAIRTHLRDTWLPRERHVAPRPVYMRDDYGRPRVRFVVEETAPHYNERDRLEFDREGEERAREFLLMHLTDSEKVEFLRKGTVTVRGKRAVYQVFRKKSYNVKAYPPGSDPGSISSYLKMCVSPAKNVPVDDHMLATILMIKHNENDFWRIANVFDV